MARRKLAAQLGLEADDPLLLLVQANANLEEKVELWSTAILELAALAKQQNQTMQETSQNSLKLMHALQSSATGISAVNTTNQTIGQFLQSFERRTGKARAARLDPGIPADPHPNHRRTPTIDQSATSAIRKRSGILATTNGCGVRCWCSG